MIEESEMLRLCDGVAVAIGSFLSTRGDPRADAGDAEAKGLVKVVRGVGSGRMPLGERRLSTALSGVNPPDIADAGVISCVLLDFVLKINGVGDPRRSTAGDLGGT